MGPPGGLCKTCSGHLTVPVPALFPGLEGCFGEHAPLSSRPILPLHSHPHRIQGTNAKGACLAHTHTQCVEIRHTGTQGRSTAHIALQVGHRRESPVLCGYAVLLAFFAFQALTLSEHLQLIFALFIYGIFSSQRFSISCHHGEPRT